MSDDASYIRAHREWLGLLGPEGLVVAPRALVDAQAIIEANAASLQIALEEILEEARTDGEDTRRFPSFVRFATRFLEWDPVHIAGGASGPPLEDKFDVVLPEYNETLRPTFAAIEDPAQKPLLLIKEEPPGLNLDKVAPDLDPHRWQASPQARFERLLRETEIPIGLLSNRDCLRLVYAPKGESSGHVTFPVAALTRASDRSPVAALKLLLGRDRLFLGPIAKDRQLHALLVRSRKYQNEVSEELAEQVLDSLWDLLRGLQSANEATDGKLLRDVLREDPQSIYTGLLGTLMRLVFLLYAEDRGLMPQGELYQRNYSITGLFDRLREDHAAFPETMDQRHGAWSQLLTLFRLIHDGASHPDLKLPARHGRLFDPDTWDFLEGRPWNDQLDRTRPIETPKIPDGAIHRVLANLIYLAGERISYRTLDVEEIGSVYEAMMGFELRVATGPSVALKPKDMVVNLDDVLKTKPDQRAKHLADEAECKVEGKALAALKEAKTTPALLAALATKLSRRTKQSVPEGSLYLQPTEERRRSGSHYTPRSLTKPIIETTLTPILKSIGEKPTPDQILALKVCDPAMGSGAFLVESCRFLAEKLVDSWNVHGGAPKIPPDEDPLIHARRLVATRCLYGVDKNQRAVDLAKLSLWLATLAKDHPFTFLDHSFRHGDSLVGLTRDQIASFHWEPGKQIPLVSARLKKAIEDAETKRAAIHALGDEGDTGDKATLNTAARSALDEVRRAGDLVIAAFFAAEKEKDRNRIRQQHADEFIRVLDKGGDPTILDTAIAELTDGPRPVPPFHWQIEFPEVFSRTNPGFDAFVGNPPFAGKNTLAASTRSEYPEWLKSIHEESHGASDIVAHFFRRTFNLLRRGGALGLIATNTIAQGDTRSTGLRWVCLNGGAIYNARKRYKWPGKAAVVVSIVHLAKHPSEAFRPIVLDDRPVPQITAFLFHTGGHTDPARLAANTGKSFQGSIVLGMGFTFDDSNPDATPIAEMNRLIETDPRNAECIFPYIGGEEVNDSPTHAHHRYVINFGEMSEQEAREWPDLMAIVEAKVKPQRARLGGSAISEKRRKFWWQFGSTAKELYSAIRGLDRVLVLSQVSKYFNFAFLPTSLVFSHRLYVFTHNTAAGFAVLQSTHHNIWALFFGSSLEDRPMYANEACYATFPFPAGWESKPRLAAAGREYYDYRARLMLARGEGLTETYNRFHDPNEQSPETHRLRELHAALDRAVLDTYGWTDIQPTSEFLLDYEEEEPEPGVKTSKKKKPWRYRWPDEIRDEVLARLLALNAERAKEEQLSSASAQRAKSRQGAKKHGAGKMFDEG